MSLQSFGRFMVRFVQRLCIGLAVGAAVTVGAAWAEAAYWHRHSALEKLVELMGIESSLAVQPSLSTGRRDFMRVPWQRRFGWPLSSLELSVRGDGAPSDDTLCSGIVIPGYPQHLPVIPTFPGFLVNLIAASAVVGVANLLLSATRRGRRVAVASSPVAATWWPEPIRWRVPNADRRSQAGLPSSPLKN